jgi:hypothetical protein
MALSTNPVHGSGGRSVFAGEPSSGEVRGGFDFCVSSVHVAGGSHRAITRLVRPTLEFNSFRSTAATLAEFNPMPVIRKARLETPGDIGAARPFLSLAG